MYQSSKVVIFYMSVLDFLFFSLSISLFSLFFLLIYINGQRHWLDNCLRILPALGNVSQGFAFIYRFWPILRMLSGHSNMIIPAVCSWGQHMQQTVLMNLAWKRILLILTAMSGTGRLNSVLTWLLSKISSPTYILVHGNISVSIQWSSICIGQSSWT